MASQTFSPLTFVLITFSVLTTVPGKFAEFRPSAVELNHQILARSTSATDPLTPPGKPAPDDSSSTGSTT